MQRITANLPDEAVEAAKVAAVKARKPLAHWVGDLVVKEIKRQTTKTKTK